MIHASNHSKEEFNFHVNSINAMLREKKQQPRNTERRLCLACHSHASIVKAIFFTVVLL